jgi:tetratricopeptide (TPR) repeat protein
MRTPILFLVFNRPAETARVFEVIRSMRPAKLYVAADGPRPDKTGEAERCLEVRKLATAVDWDCELQTLFHDRNLGGKTAIHTALSWFFAQETEGVVLEDSYANDLRPYGPAKVQFFKMGAVQGAEPDAPDVPVAPPPAPENPWALKLHEGAEALIRGDFNQATLKFTDVLAADPKNARAVVGVALAAIQRGTLDDAWALLLHALKLDPTSEETLLHYHYLAQKMDRTPEAEPLLRKSLEENPGFFRLAEALKGPLGLGLGLRL